MTSPSAISKYKLCPRKWAYSKKFPKMRKTTPSAALGIEVHDHKERWIKERKSPPLNTPSGRLAAVGLALTPSPGQCEAEKQIKQTIDGVFWWVKIDVHHLEPSWGVYDYKTTSNLEYAHTPASLAEDFQRIIYVENLLMYKEVSPAQVGDVLSRWIYLPTYLKRPKAHPVDWVEKASITHDRYVDVVHPIALEVENASREPEDHPRHLDACDEFGGCEFREICHSNLSTKEKRRAIFAPSQKKKIVMASALMEKIKARAAANGDGVIETTANEKPPADVPPTPSSPSVDSPEDPAKDDPPKRRGRPPGSKNKPKSGEQPPEQQVLPGIEHDVGPEPEMDSPPLPERETVIDLLDAEFQTARLVMAQTIVKLASRPDLTVSDIRDLAGALTDLRLF